MLRCHTRGLVCIQAWLERQHRSLHVSLFQAGGGGWRRPSQEYVHWSFKIKYAWHLWLNHPIYVGVQHTVSTAGKIEYWKIQALSYFKSVIPDPWIILIILTTEWTNSTILEGKTLLHCHTGFGVRHLFTPDKAPRAGYRNDSPNSPFWWTNEFECWLSGP